MHGIRLHEGVKEAQEHVRFFLEHPEPDWLAPETDLVAQAEQALEYWLDKQTKLQMELNEFLRGSSSSSSVGLAEASGPYPPPHTSCPLGATD